MVNLQDLNKRFVYTREKHDKWTILDDPQGSLEGDCDDYALTVAWLLAGKSRFKLFLGILFCRYVLWYCTYDVGGHIILRYKGRWVDNIQKVFFEELPSNYKLKFPFLSLFGLYAWLVKSI